MDEIIYKYLSENFDVIDSFNLDFNYDRFSHWVVCKKYTNIMSENIHNEIKYVFYITIEEAIDIINKWSKILNRDIDLHKYWRGLLDKDNFTNMLINEVMIPSEYFN